LTSGPKCAGVRRMRCTIDLAHSRKEFSLYRGALRAPSRLPTCQAKRTQGTVRPGDEQYSGQIHEDFAGELDTLHDDLDGRNLTTCDADPT